MFERNILPNTIEVKENVTLDIRLMMSTYLFVKITLYIEHI